MTLSSNNFWLKFLLVFSLFILSLENHGPNRLLLVILPFFVFIFYFFYGKSNLSPILALLKTVFFVSILSTLSYFSFFSYKENMATYSSFDFLYTTIFKLLVVFLFYNVIGKNKEFLIQIIGCVMLLHVSIFFIQFFIVYISGTYIDFLEPFTGETARYTWSVAFPFIGKTYRPTGFFNEPSTYLSIAFSLLAIKYFLSRKLYLVDKFVLLSFVLSLSFASIGVSILFLLIVNLKGKNLYKFLPFFLIIFVTLIPIVISVFIARTSGDYDALGIRLQLFNLVFNQNVLELFLGNGPVGVPSSLAYFYELGKTSWAKEGIAAINDNGLALFIFIKFGAIGLILCIVYVTIKVKKIIPLMCFLLIFITKLKFTSFIFIFAIFAIIIFGGKQKNEI